MKLSVHLVTWNGAKYVPQLFASLKNQTFKDWKLVIWDNHSQDGMVEAMKQELQSFPFAYELIEKEENSGFAGGHNALFKQTDSEYFCCLNQDLFLQPDCFEKLVKFLNEHNDAAVVSPRLMRWDFAGAEPFTNEIDSLGLQVYPSRRVREKYSNENWDIVKASLSSNKRFQENQNLVEVFGVSGTIPVFRRSLIASVLFADGTFFDESYHSYKEDVDLAFRLRLAGYRAFICLDAVVHHDRSAAGPKETSDSAAAENKKKQSEWVKYNSYKNHLMTLYKNELWQNFVLDFPFILWYEGKKFLWLFLFERKVLKGLLEIKKMKTELKSKRDQILKNKKISWKNLRKWWN